MLHRLNDADSASNGNHCVNTNLKRYDRHGFNQGGYRDVLLLLRIPLEWQTLGCDLVVSRQTAKVRHMSSVVIETTHNGAFGEIGEVIFRMWRAENNNHPETACWIPKL